MALYEYKCEKCNHEFEVLTPKPTDKKERCPKCNAIAVRLISSGGFILKDGGCGWAESGYSKRGSHG